MGVADVVRRGREGLSPIDAVRLRLNHNAELRFAGTTVTAPDRVSAWGIAHDIAAGAYKYPGLTPTPGDRVIDVGANVGIYSLWAASKGATVTAAYEPGPEAFKHLSRNVVGKPVQVVHAAVVGRASGPVRLFLHDERSTRHTLTGREIGTGTALTESVEVPAVSLTAVLAGGCDLLKIDAEGAEFDMLEHTPPDELARSARIVLEFHRRAGDPAVLLNQLRRAGFAARILEDGPEFGIIGATHPRLAIA